MGVVAKPLAKGVGGAPKNPANEERSSQPATHKGASPAGSATGRPRAAASHSDLGCIDSGSGNRVATAWELLMGDLAEAVANGDPVGNGDRTAGFPDPVAASIGSARAIC